MVRLINRTFHATERYTSNRSTKFDNWHGSGFADVTASLWDVTDHSPVVRSCITTPFVLPVTAPACVLMLCVNVM
jgi:hypothetical protein